MHRRGNRDVPGPASGNREDALSSRAAPVAHGLARHARDVDARCVPVPRCTMRSHDRVGARTPRPTSTTEHRAMTTLSFVTYALIVFAIGALGGLVLASSVLRG